MFSTLRNRFGIPGVISVMALVFAMFGGAYAASNSSDGGKATASAKAKKGPRGPKGPKGPKGDTGPAGPQGPAGPAGAKGDAGAPGAAGAAGASVNSSAEPKGVNCTEGGSKFVAGASTTYACNGAKGSPGAPGAPGAPGSPWTAGGTLPVGATETGAWTFDAPANTQIVRAPISFTIPLATPLDAAHTHYSTQEGFEDFCTGTVENPTAPSGELCVYQGSAPTAEGELIPIGARTLGEISVGGTSASGAVISFLQPESGPASERAVGRGSWAVTG